MFSKAQIRKLHIDFLKKYPDPSDEVLDWYFDNYFTDKDLAYQIWNEMFMNGALDNPDDSKESGNGSKWIPDPAMADRFVAMGGVRRLDNILLLEGYKDWVDKRMSTADPIPSFKFPDGGNTISGYFRKAGFVRQNATNYFWEKDKPHNHRITWDSYRGLLIFEKLKGATEALEGVYNNMDNKKPNPVAEEEAYEEDMYGFEAIEKSGLEELQAILATQLSEAGSIKVLEDIENGLEEPSAEFTDQMTFIKNTTDLSDTQEVLTQIMSAAETLLTDLEIDLLTEALSAEFLDDEEFEEGEPKENYEEPEDWSTVDEDMPTDLNEEGAENTSIDLDEESGESEEEPEEEEAHESLVDGKGIQAPATEEAGESKSMDEAAAYDWLGKVFEEVLGSIDDDQEIEEGNGVYNQIEEAISTAPYDSDLLHWIWDQAAELGDDSYSYDEFVALCGHYPGKGEAPATEEAGESVEPFKGDVAEYLANQPGIDDGEPISGITGDAFEEEGEGSSSVEKLRAKINQLLTDPQFREDLKAKFEEVIDPILGDDAFDEEDLAVAADEALEVTLAKYGVEPDGDQWDILSDEEGKLVELEDQVCTELYGCTIDELLTDEEDDEAENFWDGSGLGANPSLDEVTAYAKTFLEDYDGEYAGYTSAEELAKAMLDRKG